MRGTRARYRVCPREIPVPSREVSAGAFYPLQFVLLGNQPFEFFFQFLFILAVGGGQP